MKLSEDAIREFRELYLKEFNVELSTDQANERGLELLNFLKLIYRPLPTGKTEQTINVSNKARLQSTTAFI